MVLFVTGTFVFNRRINDTIDRVLDSWPSTVFKVGTLVLVVLAGGFFVALALRDANEEKKKAADAVIQQVPPTVLPSRGGA